MVGIFTSSERVEDLLLVPSVSLFLLPTRTNSADASMNRTALSFLDFFSTMMQVAIVVPKKRSGGSWITAST